MEAAAAALRGRTNLDSAGAVFSRVVTRLNFYFLHHVGVGRDDSSIVRADINHARAVYGNVILFAAKTIHVILAIGVGATAERDAFESGVIRSNNTRQNAQKFKRTTADDREV